MQMSERPDPFQPAPPPPEPGFTAVQGKSGRPRTARTWLFAAVLAVALGVVWAVLFVYGLYVWFLTIPVWLLTSLGASGTCFVLARRHPRAMSYGVGLLVSMPIAVAAALAVFLYAASR